MQVRAQLTAEVGQSSSSHVLSWDKLSFIFFLGSPSDRIVLWGRWGQT